VSEPTKRQASSLAKVENTKAALERATKAQDKARAALHDAIRRAVDAGVPPAEVARVAGVSRGRVSQLAPVPKAQKPRSHAQKKGDTVSCVTDPDTVRALPDTSVPMLSGSASTRIRRPYGRRTMFMEPAPVAQLLVTVGATVPAGERSSRVYLIGRAPYDADAGTTKAEAVRGWALGELPDGWAAESHYLADASLPVLRFRHHTGHRVTIMRAASWWGETDADLATCEAAWRGLTTELDKVPAFAGAGLADTPATAGRALWLRTVPEDKGYPVLSDEYRELIAATSGQGRIERLPQLEGAPLEDFAYVDGRLMYAALTWGMPVGEPRRWTGAEVDALSARDFTSALRGRGRWRITCTVPDGWAHVGMFMAPEVGGAWCYPNQPGQTFTTWADGSEVWAAMERGWDQHLIIHEGMTWAEGKPLDSWRNALVGIYQAAQASSSPAAALAAKAVRSLILYTIGAFAARAHTVTRSVPLEEAGAVPAGVEVRQVGESLVWQETEPASAWTLQTAHPEWSATVWARARTRLLTGRGVGQERVGALHLPAERIVAFATDALYLAGGAPGWADDGAPGRFRLKGVRPGPFEWPATAADLYRLRDEAEEAGA
jgi:hypothetical protein